MSNATSELGADVTQLRRRGRIPQAVHGQCLDCLAAGDRDRTVVPLCGLDISLSLCFEPTNPQTWILIHELALF